AAVKLESMQAQGQPEMQSVQQEMAIPAQNHADYVPPAEADTSIIEPEITQNAESEAVPGAPMKVKEVRPSLVTREKIATTNGTPTPAKTEIRASSMVAADEVAEEIAPQDEAAQ